MARARRLGLVFAVAVVAPTVIATAYYGAVVTPQFESVAIAAVDSGLLADQDKSGNKGGAKRDLQVVRALIESRAMLEVLAKDHTLITHYQNADLDWFSRLTHAPGSDEALDYYQSHVTVEPNADATLSVRVRAFSADKAHEVAVAIISEAERHLDEQSDLTRKHVIEQAETGVTSARQRLLDAGGTSPRDDLEMEVARQRLAASLRALELVEQDAARRKRSLWIVAAPSTPTAPSYPKRLWNIATVFVTALALGALALLLGDFVREHAKF